MQGSDSSDSESDGWRRCRSSARNRATSGRTRSARAWECPDSGSSEAADAEGSSGSVLHSGARGTGVVDLSFGALATVHSRGEREGRLTEYEKNGMCLKRLKAVMANACGCSKGCYSKLDVKGMHQLNICWHSTLTASERRYVMSFLYEQATGDVGSDSKTRVHWSLNGSQVCKLAFTAVLGTNRRAIKKLIEGQLDLRSVLPNRAQAGEPQAQKVHEFFLGLYRTAAEPLPHEHYMVRGSVDKNIDITENNWRFEKVPEFDEADEHTEIWNPDRSMVEDFAAFLGGEVGLARRFLPHSKLTTLYWLMNTTMEQEAAPDDEVNVPSWSVFYRVWKGSWANHLHFRKSSQHADCKICFECREKMHKSGLAMRERLDMARQWREHLRNAYHDRMIYWWCRYASRHSMDVLTIIIDSMDKAKFAWPQWPWGRADKALDGVHRPRLVVTGGLAHGFFTCLFVAEDTVSHGSCAFCDVLTRILELVYAQCKERRIAFPRHLVVQSDNTTAQAKNQYVAKFLAFLVGRFKFATANLFFLPVGHTHEDIGRQLFAVGHWRRFRGSTGFWPLWSHAQSIV